MTERLRLVKAATALGTFDAYEHWGESDTIDEETRFLGWGPHATPKDSRDALDSFADEWEDGSAAVYAIVPRESEDGAGELAGTATLSPGWTYRRAELDSWLRKPFWGRGYAGECAGALLQLAFDRLGLGVVDVGHDPRDEQSKRAIEKYVDRYGGQSDGVFRNWESGDDGPVDIHRYSVSKREWREAVGDERETRFVDEDGAMSRDG